MATTYREPRLTRTRIIATVGPACATRDMLRELVLSGVDVFRLNFAHGTHEWLTGIVGLIRELEAELGRPLGILGDLSGPKIRLGEIPGGSVACPEGAEFTFIRGTASTQLGELTCTYAPLIDDVRPGDRVLLADGTVTMRVVAQDSAAGFARCMVESAGTLRSRQGVNLPGVKLSTPSVTEKDRTDLAWAIAHGVDFIGLSFVRSAADITLLRTAITELTVAHAPMIVAKIEKPEAVDDIEAILDETDAVMVARGDLGVEADIVKVPAIQKRIIRLCNRRRIPVITATQMLDSMQSNELPTRAEASDVANAVLDGTDAVMLSGETAAGQYPRQAVTMMSRIIREAEQLLPLDRVMEDSPQSESRALAVTEAVVVGAVATAEKLNAALLAVATVSGRSVLATSKERSLVPILAICREQQVARRLTLLWGVTPLVSRQPESPIDGLARLAAEWGQAEGVVSPGQSLVVIAGSRWDSHGHDAMLVHQV